MSPDPPGTNGEDRTLGRTAARHDHDVLEEDGCRRGDLRAAAQAPSLFTGLWIVATDEVRRVGHQLGAPTACRLIDRRRTPGGQLLPHRLPHRLPRGEIGGEDERLVLRIALHDREVLVDDRRAGRAPLVLGQVVRADVEDAQVFLPDLTPVHVERVEPLRSEGGHDVASVGDGAGVGVGRFDVTLLTRLPFVRRARPDRLARSPIERHHHPLLRRAILRGRPLTVESWLEGCAAAATNRRRHEHAIAPHDRTRVREPWHLDLPLDVLPCGDVPALRQALTIRDPRGGRSTKRGPVSALALRASAGARRRLGEGGRDRDSHGNGHY
jgi:hypothetical protein